MVRVLELIFIPMPAMGHHFPALEVAEKLVKRDERISITILIMNLPFYDPQSYIKSFRHEKRIKFIELPPLEEAIDMRSRTFFEQTAEAYGPIVSQTVNRLFPQPGSETRIGGLVVDMFCSSMIDVAKELNLPSYVFFTSGAAPLSLMFHLQSLRDDSGVDVTDATEFSGSGTELEVPGFKKRVPGRVLPAPMLDPDTGVLDHAKRFRGSRGIVVNTFLELESHTIASLSKDPSIPRLYPVGPIINYKDEESDESQDSITRWLDDQPPASVVLLCFGTMGAFTQEQVREVAEGLERSGQRFLWVLRRPPSGDGNIGPLTDFESIREVLPNGFTDRTSKLGKVVGWVSQTTVLSHPAIGSFVSHCGWNSTLESLWFGVPIAAWPMYAEQQLNGFNLVEEWGLAAEIRLDYLWDPHTKMSNGLVRSEEIEEGLRSLMEDGDKVRSNVKVMSEKSRKAMEKGESSDTWLGEFIKDVFENVSTLE